MANNRVAIRAAIKTMLSGNTSAGTNVYTNRETRLWESELPAILLQTETEPVVPEALNSRRYYRTLELHIKIKAEGTTSVDDTLDALVAEVETIMDANPGLSGSAITSQQTNTTVTLNSDGEKDVGEATLTYEVKYIS